MELVTAHWDKWQAAGAAYPVIMTVPGEDVRQLVFTAYKNGAGVYMKAAAIPDQGQEFVDGLATGCMFIKREVFEKLQKPYFEFKYDAETRSITEGEDLGFCLKVNNLGIKFFTDYSMVCKHYKHVCLLEMNNYAIEYAKKAVAAYDRDVRDKVLALAEKVREKVTPTPQSKSQLILPHGR